MRRNLGSPMYIDGKHIPTSILSVTSTLIQRSILTLGPSTWAIQNGKLPSYMWAGVEENRPVWVHGWQKRSPSSLLRCLSMNSTTVSSTARINNLFQLPIGMTYCSAGHHPKRPPISNMKGRTFLCKSLSSYLGDISIPLASPCLRSLRTSLFEYGPTARKRTNYVSLTPSYLITETGPL